jgi:hypothetical protein
MDFLKTTYQHLRRADQFLTDARRTEMKPMSNFLLIGLDLGFQMSKKLLIGNWRVS